MRLNKFLFLATLSILLLTGCDQNIKIAVNNNQNLQTEWQEIDTGVQFKEIPVYSNNNTLNDVIIVFKFNPDQFNFSFKKSSTAMTVAEWQEKYDPLFICNGSYFLENNEPAGLLKINGNTAGKKLSAESVGELVINNQGKLNILENADIDKYDNVLQSYPLLQGISEDSGQLAPRTVVAKDEEGNILFIFTKKYYFSLYTLQNYLQDSDLNIDIALNLDGGPSTGYFFKGKEERSYPSQAVANVIMINKK